MCNLCIDDHYGASCDVSCSETSLSDCDPHTGR